ncbi:cholesterol oxidase [Mycobacterium ulcerans str. Harvey]|uniref:Cholesterol oxidase n=1 Tax=Mycobacterium ulcerans str. Harvey TaxID=1299332 RepID=A0ABP3ALW6_MYCUL|nr:cholesterol oxidase [Mycobacterium ulcerans str. Harvey]
MGGGSLNYANTLYVPPDPFFNDQQWKHITDWRDELMPHYQQAQRMLGVVKNPTFTDADRIVKEVADEMGFGDTWVPTPVGCSSVPTAPRRRARRCPTPTSAVPARANRLHRMRRVHDRLSPWRQEHPGKELPWSGGIGWCRGDSDDHGEGLRAAAGRVVGGSDGSHRQLGTTGPAYLHRLVPDLGRRYLGTQHLLFKMRDKGKLPRLSKRLGVLTRTNSESIVGAATLKVNPDLDLTHGVAITSSIHPTPDTHVEPVRYGKGSNAMGLLQTLMTDGSGPSGTDVARWRQLLDQAGESPRRMFRLINPGSGASAR